MAGVRFSASSSEYWKRDSGTLLDRMSDYTIMGWVVLKSTDLTFGLFSLWNDGDNYEQFGVGTLWTGTNDLYINGWGSGTSGSATGGTTLSTDVPYHITARRSGDTVEILLDGVSDISATLSNGTAGNETLQMAAGCDINYDGTYYHFSDASFYHLKAWSAALSDGEVAVEMRSIFPVRLADLYDFWPVINESDRAKGFAKGYNWTEVNTPTNEGSSTMAPWGVHSDRAILILPAATGGDQTVSPSGIASGEAFGTATVTPGEVTVSPSGIASGEAFGTATVTPGEVTVSPSGIASAEAFGTATVTPGEVTLTPTGIASAEAFGTAVITPGEVTVSPTGIASLEAFGTPTVFDSAVQTITVTGIASAEQFGTPRLLRPPTGTAIVVA